MVVGTALSAGGALAVRHWEGRAVQARSEAAAYNRAAAFERELRNEEARLTAIWLHARGPGGLAPAGFTNFVDHMLPRGERSTTYFWVPRIAGPGARESFPVAIRAGAGGARFPAGYDMVTDATVREAFEAARATGQPAASRRLRLEDGVERYGVLLVRPVFYADLEDGGPPRPAAELAGFVAGLVEVAQVMERGLRYLRSYGIDVVAFDADAAPEEAFLYLHWSRRRGQTTGPAARPSLAGREAGDYQTDVTVSGRRWLVRCRPVPEKISEGPSWQPWGVLVGGIVITLLITGSFRLQYSRTARVEALVARRTAELSEANARLIGEIRERRKTEEALAVARDQALEASRLKSQFLANVSHEIRTPLNGILGMTELLLATGLAPDQRECAETVERSGHGLLALINDLLDMSRIEAGKLTIVSEPFSLRTLLRETHDLALPGAAKKGLSLRLAPPEDAPDRLEGDCARIRQVLNNLLGNAVKFTETGEVEFGAAVAGWEGDRVRIRFEVRDTGVGIEPEAQKRLFHRFVQADGTSARRFGGTGLGLAISRQLVELMGGKIGLESRPGSGSRFWFELPLRPVGDADARSVCGSCRPAVRGDSRPRLRPAVESAGMPASCRILLAEDNLVNRKVAVRFLERLGCQVEEVANGAEAVRACHERDFHAVLMDCQMPGVDGFQATALIRASERAGQRIPIIALTANAMTGDRERCLSADMDDYLAKPLEMSALAAALNRWVGTAAGV